jgi:hypothetical protein
MNTRYNKLLPNIRFAVLGDGLNVRQDVLERAVGQNFERADVESE